MQSRRSEGMSNPESAPLAEFLDSLVYLPIQDGSKAPAAKGWADPEYPGVNPAAHETVGLRLDDFVVVDTDTPEATAAWEGEGPPTNYVVVTARGKHFYYRLEPGQRPPKSGHYAAGIDVKAGRGAYVIAAGSKHPSGAFYTALGDAQLTQARPAPPELFTLLAAMKPEPERTTAADEWQTVPEGERNTRLAGIAGSLRRQGANIEVIANTLAFINAKYVKPPLDGAEIVGIARSVERYEPDPDEGIGEIVFEHTDGTTQVPGLLPIRSWKSIDPAPEVEWAWFPYLPAGRLVLLAGSGGVGKSMAAVTMALMFMQGKGPDGDIEQGNVLWLPAEDDPADVVARMEAAGGQRCCDGEVFFVDEDKWRFYANEDGDMTAFRATIRELNIRLVVMDPLRSFLGNGISYNKEGEVRPPLERLNKAAVATKATILGVHHWRKGSDAPAVERATGSHAFTDVVRHQLSMQWEGDTTFGHGAFAVTKSNIGPTGYVRAYDIEAGNWPVWRAGEPQPEHTLDEWAKEARADIDRPIDIEGPDGKVITGPNPVLQWCERNLAPGSAIPSRERLVSETGLSYRKVDEALQAADLDDRVSYPKGGSGLRVPRMWSP